MVHILLEERPIMPPFRVHHHMICSDLEEDLAQVGGSKEKVAGE